MKNTDSPTGACKALKKLTSPKHIATTSPLLYPMYRVAISTGICTVVGDNSGGGKGIIPSGVNPSKTVIPHSKALAANVRVLTFIFIFPPAQVHKDTLRIYTISLY